MTEAEKMLEALGFRFDGAKDYGQMAFCHYKNKSTTVQFSIIKAAGKWEADVSSFDHDIDDYAFPRSFDVRLARAIVKRLEELNGAL